MRATFVSLLAVAASAVALAEAPLPWGDQGDGTFRNQTSDEFDDPEGRRG